MENTTLSGVGAEEFESAWVGTTLKQWLVDHPNASITGHSQGGAQAQMLAYRAAENSISLGQLVTFNSAGTNKIDTDLSSTLSFSDVTHFISAGDIVSQVGVQFVPGKVIYYDLNFQETDRYGYLPLVYAAHTDHWAQDELYTAKFLRTEKLPATQSVWISKAGPTYGDLNNPAFSHLNEYPEVDNEFLLFKAQFLGLLYSYPSLQKILGFGVTRADVILSSRAGSESARIDELPKLLGLISNIVTIAKKFADFVWVTGDEVLEFASTILSKAADLGYAALDAALDFSLLVLKTAEDIGLSTLDLVLDFAGWLGTSMIEIGSFFQGAVAVGFEKFLNTSEDYADWLMSRFDKNAPVVVVEGSNAQSTPAIIIDTVSGDSSMTSASGNSVYVLGEGKETVILSGENNVVFGLPEAINQTRVENFGITDALFLGNVQIDQNDLSARKGSAILSLDTDGDEQVDVEIMLAGDFRLESFVVETSRSGSYIRYLGNAVPAGENDDVTTSMEGFATDENSAFTTGNVLANDRDDDGDALKVTAVDTSNTKGLVIDNGDGTFNYDPKGAFEYLGSGETATDSFIYTVSDGNGGNTTATVVLTINGLDEILLLNPITGSAGNDYLLGTTYADVISSLAGNDILIGLAGNDNINGGADIDTAVYAASRSLYTITQTLSGLTVNDSSGAEGTDTLTNVERLQFADSSLAFDLDGNAGQTYRIYQAALNRTPDLAGLGGWISAMDGGMTLEQVATGFIASAEFQGLYGANPTHAQFVNLLYGNVLHRAPDQAGLAAWVDLLSTHVLTAEGVLIGFSESAENKNALLPAIQEGIVFTRPHQFTGSPAADIIIGTSSADTLSGLAGNDILIGLTGNDSIDGGADIDTAVYSSGRSAYSITQTASNLIVVDTFGVEGTDTLTNIERLQFADANLAFDLAGNAGQTYRLYQAAFNRTPDQPGLGYWIHSMDDGMTLQQVATGFMGSAEFQSLYGANPSNGELINLLYGNVLHRAADQAGYDAWMQALDSGVISREGVLIGFSESNENKIALTGATENGIEYQAWL